MNPDQPVIAKARACPNCGSSHTRRDQALRPRPSVAMALFFGLYYLLVRGAFGRCSAQCLDCGHYFRYKTVGSWIVLAVVILIVTAILASRFYENEMYD